jgi:hypothetical protein
MRRPKIRSADPPFGSIGEGESNHPGSRSFFTTTLTKGTKESTKTILRFAQMIFVLAW